MRHFLTLRPQAAHPRRMRQPAPAARLVALASLAQRAPAGPAGAITGAVDLAPVTAAADNHLAATGRAQEQPPAARLGLRPRATQPWTHPVRAAILLLHACPARCRARRRCRT